jgi:nitroreductase
MQLSNAIKSRKSVKRFLDKKPDWRKIIKAIDMARFAPTAGNQFCLKFILIKDEKKINKISEAAQQTFINKAHFVVAVVSDDTKLKQLYDKRGTRYARQQAGAAIQNFLLALTEQGLATTWIGHFVDSQIKQALELPSGVNVEAIFPIGKETKALAQSQSKQKPDLENLLYFDKWKNKTMQPQTRVRLGSV